MAIAKEKTVDVFGAALSRTIQRPHCGGWFIVESPLSCERAFTRNGHFSFITAEAFSRMSLPQSGASHTPARCGKVSINGTVTKVETVRADETANAPRIIGMSGIGESFVAVQI